LKIIEDKLHKLYDDDELMGDTSAEDIWAGPLETIVHSPSNEPIKFQ
jgi:hypothetical protein